MSQVRVLPMNPKQSEWLKSMQGPEVPSAQPGHMPGGRVLVTEVSVAVVVVAVAEVVDETVLLEVTVVGYRQRWAVKGHSSAPCSIDIQICVPRCWHTPTVLNAQSVHAGSAVVVVDVDDTTVPEVDVEDTVVPVVNVEDTVVRVFDVEDTVVNVEDTVVDDTVDDETELVVVKKVVAITTGTSSTSPTILVLHAVSPGPVIYAWTESGVPALIGKLACCSAMVSSWLSLEVCSWLFMLKSVRV